MLNIIVTASNLIGIYGVSNYFQKGLYLECIVILSSITFSIIYHLFENKKHNMPGMGFFRTFVGKRDF